MKEDVESLENYSMLFKLPEIAEKNKIGEGMEACPELTGIIEAQEDQIQIVNVTTEEERSILTGFPPISENREIRCILSISSDWTEFKEKTGRRSIGISVIVMILVLLSEGLRLFYILRTAVKPFKKEMKVMNDYIGNKDSEAVVREMSKVTQLNEFGLHAEHIAMLVWEIDLKEGGILFVYTDGVPEATRKDRKMYDTAQLLDRLNRQADLTPEKLVEGVRQDVANFVDDAEPFDDLTILCLRYSRGKGKTTEE